VKICILGCGDMGKQHAAAWAARDDCEVAAVFDPDESRRQQLADSTGAKSYATVEEAITHQDIDIVSICTPVCFHAQAAILAAQNRKHILCEKPIALTLQDADAMIDAAARNNVHLAISFQYRGFSKHLHYRRLFQEGAFGSPIFFRVADIREVRPKLAMHRRSMNGGPIIDMAPHLFDLMRFYTDREPVRVFAQGHVFGKNKPRLANVDDLAIDAASIDLTMQDGHVAQIFLNWGMPENFPGQSEEMLIGPDLCARPLPGGIELLRNKEKQFLATEPDPKGPSVRIADLLGAVRDEHPLQVTGEDGKIALAVSLAALESIDTDRVVTIPSSNRS